MRTIDALPIANAAPLVDQSQRLRMLGKTMIGLGLLVNLVVLGTMLAVLFGAVDRGLVPIVLPGIAVGGALSAWGNRYRKRANG